MNDKNAIQRHPVAAFYILAFLFSWLGWIPQTLRARGLISFDSPLLALLGGVGPTLAAIAVLLALGEKNGVRALFAALFQFKASAGWFVFVFGFWFVVAAVALGAGALFGQPLPALDQFAWGGLIPIFIGMLISNVWEEIGWRGFALPRLQEKYTDLHIVFLMGLLWSLWHLPLLLNPSSPMSGLPWYGEIVFSLSLTAIYTWLYRNTARSLFFVSVFHAMSNTVAFALHTLGVFVSSYGFVVGAVAVVAIGIILIHGPRRFARAAE